MPVEEQDTYDDVERARANTSRVVKLAFSNTNRFRVAYKTKHQIIVATTQELDAPKATSKPYKTKSNDQRQKPGKRAVQGIKALRDIAWCNQMVLRAMEITNTKR